jgi:hypothetical protein
LLCDSFQLYKGTDQNHNEDISMKSRVRFPAMVALALTASACVPPGYHEHEPYAENGNGENAGPQGGSQTRPTHADYLWERHREFERAKDEVIHLCRDALGRVNVGRFRDLKAAENCVGRVEVTYRNLPEPLCRDLADAATRAGSPVLRREGLFCYRHSEGRQADFSPQ